MYTGVHGVFLIKIWNNLLFMSFYLVKLLHCDMYWLSITKLIYVLDKTNEIMFETRILAGKSDSLW